LTENLGAVISTLQALRPGDVRPGGTDLGAALASAADVFGHEAETGGRTIVLFSDGEDHAGSWGLIIDRLRSAGIVVHTVAIGDAGRGHLVPSEGGSTPMLYGGSQVISRRIDQPLAALARATGGAMVPLGLAAVDLGDLFLNRIEPVASRNRQMFRPTEHAERFRWFVLAALGIGLAGSWPGRGWRRGRGGLRRLSTWACLAAVVSLGAGAATGASSTSAEAVEVGRTAYFDGRWADALAAFDHAIDLDESAAIPRYDAAAALFQLRRYREALDQYQAARDRAEERLRTRIDYALGNTALALGDVAIAIEHYDACIASVAEGSDLDSVRRDAAINRRFAEEAARKAPAPNKPEHHPSRAPGSPAPRSKGQDPTEPEPSGRGANRPAVGDGPRDEASPGRRGAGGAGGSGGASPLAGTPDEQLDAALDRVREALSRRLPETGPPESVPNYKDW
jgi:Ca-activated chloride channel family protein